MKYTSMLPLKEVERLVNGPESAVIYDDLLIRSIPEYSITRGQMRRFLSMLDSDPFLIKKILKYAEDAENERSMGAIEPSETLKFDQFSIINDLTTLAAETEGEAATTFVVQVRLLAQSYIVQKHGNGKI